MKIAATTGVLDADDIEGAAGPGEYSGALRQMVRAIHEQARLTPEGMRSARASLARSLAIQRAVAGAPHRQVRQPILVITGLHRTGTTLLQELIDAHPEVRAPHLWELLAPVDEAAPDQLQRAATRYVQEYYRAAPGFAAIHPLHARKPEECHRLIGNSLHSEIFAMRYRVPDYLDWLERQDHRAAYRLHRDQLALILARRPGRHVVLKCPFHLWHPDELAATYPQARVVRLHRDPSATIASVCSLTATIRRARSHRVDPHEIGDFWLRRTAAAEPRLLAQCAQAFAGLPVLDVGYPDLARDPVGVLRRVCEFAGLGFGATAEQRLRDAAEAAAGRSAGHRYRLEDFGLDPIRTRNRFAAYRAAYRL